MTAGLRGSSSECGFHLADEVGATSAPLVKMPPPRRAKIEISEPPKARPMSECSARLIADAPAHREKIAGHAEQSQAHTSMPVIAPPRNATCSAR